MSILQSEVRLGFGSFVLTFFCFLALNNTVCSQTKTIFSGNWNDINNWDNGVPNANSNVSVQHDMLLNVNLSINNNRSYTIEESGSITDPAAGGGSFGIQIGNNGLLDVNGNTTVNGNFRSGGLIVREYDTLIVGNAEFISNSDITIDEFAVLIINGDLDMNAGFFQALNLNCDGVIFVNGDITANSGFLGSVNISGSGKIQATGTVSGNGWPAPSFFGSTNINCTNNCEYGGGAGLPIELIRFDAMHTGEGKVKVEWVTETEINNDHFIVERSTDGYIFKEIAKVKGAGNSLNKRHYGITSHSEPVVTYYRLTQVGFDGVSKTFPPIPLEASNHPDQQNLLVYPNPVQLNGTIKIYSKDVVEGATLEIRDISGKLLLSEKLNSSLNEINLNESFRNGIYIVTLISENNIETRKLIVGQ